MLIGQKIILRAISQTDIPFFLNWYNDSSVIQYIESYLPISKINEDEWMKNMLVDRIGTDIIFVIDDMSKKIPIGTCGLHKINSIHHSAEISIVIGNIDYWGKGYGTEVCNLLIKYAFYNLNLNRVYTGAYDFNERSIKMVTKSGFKKEGVQQQAVYKNGSYHDVILFGLLKKDYKI